VSDGPWYSLAREDFGKVRKREVIARMLALLTAQKTEMLSLGDVRSLLKPEGETYRGMQVVPLAKIVGSEGRFKDFDREFLPRHDKLMRRWMRVDLAHYANVVLPPIKLFEVGGVYFVRDGNHRVSVARARGTEFIDAEVTSLSTEIAITPDMTREGLLRAVIDFEKRRFMEQTGLGKLRPGSSVEFTEVGRYDELLAHIREHKWYINLRRAAEIPYAEAVASWYDTVYMPIVEVIRSSRLLGRFPGKTEADLYVFVGKHWSELNRRYGPLFTLEEAAEDFSSQERRPAASARRLLRALAGAARRLVERIR
jgi:hypothetical protein